MSSRRDQLQKFKGLNSPVTSYRKSLGSSYTPSAPSPSSEARLLSDKLFENIQLLIQYVDFPNLGPFILAQKLMTGEEYSRVNALWSARHLQEAVVEMLLNIRHKPDWGRKLFTALEDAVTHHSDGLIHLGHVYVLKEFREYKNLFTDGLEKMTLELESLLQSVDVYSSMRTEDTLGLLTVYLPLLMQYTDIEIIIPFLKVMRLLTDEDYQQIKKLWQSGHRRDAVESLLFILSRKCPEWEDCFVSALHQSLHSEYGDYHEGHKHILEILFNSGAEQGARIHKNSCLCTCHYSEHTESNDLVYPVGETMKATRKAAIEFRQSASSTIKGLYHNLEKCQKALDTSNSVYVEWLRHMSTQLGTLSTLCSDLMGKCQHRRLQQGIRKSLGQLEIGASAFDSQIDRQERKYATEIKQSHDNSFTLNPGRVEYKEMKEMLHNLDDYVTELIEWTDTAFATIYPHDDMVLIHEWGP